jgi:hypothetical protein
VITVPPALGVEFALSPAAATDRWLAQLLRFGAGDVRRR